MKISECRKTAGICLRGRYGEAFVVTAICLFAFVTFKAAEAVTAYGIGNMRFSSAVDGVIILTGFLVMTPLLTGGVWWFFRTAGGEDNSGLLKLYSGFRLNSRALVLYALMWSKAFFSMFPSAFCLTASYVIICGHTGLDGETALFSAFQLAMLGIALLLLYIGSLASMAAAPFLFIDRPDSNPFGIMRKSARLMKGNKLRLVGLISGYIPAMLPIVTIPFVIPKVIMSAAVFIREIINENGQ